MAHRLLFHDPGHFHAALTLRVRNPRLDRRIDVYARPGPELEAFLALVKSFNNRTTDPTDWEVRVHGAQDPLSLLIAERRGELVVGAGRPPPPRRRPRGLHENGFQVLADKPWITTSASLDDLARVTGGPPIAMDIMTERYDTLARLRRRIVSTPSLFGRLADDESPAIDLGSVHHLCKVVDGRPLRRPEWYYDVAIQGDGLVDIQSHMTDQAQWLIGATDQDVVIEAARRWSTPVPRAVYEESTGAPGFPEALAASVVDGTLQLACNGEIDYRLSGVWVRQRAEWRLRQPAGGGDAHRSIVRGTGASIVLRQGPETDHRAQLYVDAPDRQDLQARLRAALEDWRAAFPGLDIAPSEIGFELLVPPHLETGHEAHFPMVLDGFLDHVESGKWPEELARDIRARYSLLARARDLAQRT